MRKILMYKLAGTLFYLSRAPIFYFIIFFLVSGFGIALAQTPPDTTPGGSAPQINKKAYVLIFDPILRNGQKLSAYMGWDFQKAALDGVETFKDVSNGRVNYTIAYTKEVNDSRAWLKKTDGFTYDEDSYLAVVRNQTLHHEPDYADYYQFLNDQEFDICGKFNRGEIDELWVNAGPWFGFYETALASSPGGPAGFWVNGPTFTNASCQKLMIIGLPGLHTYGHMAESTMQYVFNASGADVVLPSGTPLTTWDKYVSNGYKMSTATGPVGCGSIHFDPLARIFDDNYDHSFTDRSILSYCGDFSNYPNLGDPAVVSTPLTCQAWSCSGDGYEKWWWQHLPHFAGTSSDGILNDWWQYIFDPNLAYAMHQPVSGTFSNLSATMPGTGGPATFNFEFSGRSNGFTIDAATVADSSALIYDIFWGFASASQAPVVLQNPSARWDKYSCGRTLYWQVTAAGSGDKSPVQSTVVTCADVTPPTVSITAPVENAQVQGEIAISAQASDNVGVAGVQFNLDGASLGGEDAIAPYSVSWSTITATNGAHSLTAVARDATGNQASSAAVTVVVGNYITQAAGPVRGSAGDLWADVVIGQRDFGEITPREIVPYRVFNPNGVIVDRNVSPGRAYVWDSGNNRVLGFDLAKCYAQPSQPCSADVVIGQPSGYDHGACNGDSAFQNYPNRAKASASTLCGMWEGTPTVLEDKTFSNMYVDNQGNLYVPDVKNNRVLKYNQSFSTDKTDGKGDSIADEVWGQDDFTGNACSKTGDVMKGIYPVPDGSSICFQRPDYGDGAGVTQDAAGNLWVADGGNNRVLRFPVIPATGIISKTADFVLGQTNFTTYNYGAGLNQMHSPTALRFDSQGNLYVVDTANNRVLIFNPPFSTGMGASATFGEGFPEDELHKTDPLNFVGPASIEFDPFGQGVFVLDYNSARVSFWNMDGTFKAKYYLGHRSGGSIGIDAQGNLLHSQDVFGQDIHRFTPQANGTYQQNGTLLNAGSYNLVSDKRLDNSAWVGMTTVADQLVVAVNRLLFWNGLDSLTNGRPADGYIGASNFTSYPVDGNYGQVKSDADNRVWAIKGNDAGSAIEIYQAPLHIGDKPIKTLSSPIPVLGGGQIDLYPAIGLAPTAHGEYLWVTQGYFKHRVVRIRDPLSNNPLVDVVLGQKAISAYDRPRWMGDTPYDYAPNRGEIDPPNVNPERPAGQDAKLDMLCFPGAISLDKRGNLFVSDHVIEVEGNWRLLMFSAGLFPDNPSAVIFAPFATKEFPRWMPELGTGRDNQTFEPAFDSQNHMVVGFNPAWSNRFVKYYNDPTKVNLANPSDPAYAKPDGQFKDYYGWPVAATFDANDNLYVFDANRSRVLVYKKPLARGVSGSSGGVGDINDDLRVDVLDVQACANSILGIQDLGNRADVNQDTSIDILDVQVIVNIVLGV